MAKGGRKVRFGRKSRFPNYVVKHKPRFNGRVNVFEPWFKFMDPINIKMYYGGHFVTKNNKITYEKKPNVGPSKWGIALRVNVEEVCYFEFVYWIKNYLGFAEVGDIWFRKKGCTLHSGRAKIEGDKDISAFLEAPEKDGFYHLYVVHADQVEGVKRNYYGPARNVASVSHESDQADLMEFKNKCPSPEIIKEKKKSGRPKKNVAAGEGMTDNDATPIASQQLTQATQQSIRLSAPQ
uniref:PB1-like domain-containing protein n=1 Tax=Chenopodium quinoa TaxID=63459 RepID=A0A803NAF9_CHEQI